MKDGRIAHVPAKGNVRTFAVMRGVARWRILKGKLYRMDNSELGNDYDNCNYYMELFEVIATIQNLLSNPALYCCYNVKLVQVIRRCHCYEHQLVFWYIICFNWFKRYDYQNSSSCFHYRQTSVKCAVQQHAMRKADVLPYRYRCSRLYWWSFSAHVSQPWHHIETMLLVYVQENRFIFGWSIVKWSWTPKKKSIVIFPTW